MRSFTMGSYPQKDCTSRGGGDRLPGGERESERDSKARYRYQVMSSWRLTRGGEGGVNYRLLGEEGGGCFLVVCGGKGGGTSMQRGLLPRRWASALVPSSLQGVGFGVQGLRFRV